MFDKLRGVINQKMANAIGASNLLKEISMNRSIPQGLTKELDEWGFVDKKLRCGNDVSMTKNLISQIQAQICSKKIDYSTDLLSRLELNSNKISDVSIKKDFEALYSELLWLILDYDVQFLVSDDIQKQEKRDNEILLKISDRSLLWEKYERLESTYLESKYKNEKLESECRVLNTNDTKKTDYARKLVSRLNDTEAKLALIKVNLSIVQTENSVLKIELNKFHSGIGQYELLKENKTLISKCNEYESREQKKEDIGTRVMDRVMKVESYNSLLKNELELSKSYNMSLLKELEAIKSSNCNISQIDAEQRSLLTSTTNKVLEQEKQIFDLEKKIVSDKKEYLKSMKYFSRQSFEAMKTYNTLLEDDDSS